MGFMDIFTPDTINKTVDNIVSGGDMLFYTDEEKAIQLQKTTETKLSMLNNFEPFKLAQRYLAFAFTINFILCVWVAVSFLVFSSDEQLKEFLKIIDVFSIGWIMLAIVSFYFTGGLINSYKTNKKG